jgi:hypothetical protein
MSLVRAKSLTSSNTPVSDFFFYVYRSQLVRA